MSRPSSARPRARLAGTAVLGLVATGGLLSACSGGNATADVTPTVTTGSGGSGALRVTGAYIPQPANPAVAAAYFTVADSGPADAVTGVTCDVGTDVGLHETVDTGSTGSMVPVASIPVPAHGSVRLKPGGYHVMIMNPGPLAVGQHVRMTVRFAHAEPVTLAVPVVAMTGPMPTGSMSMGSMSMGSMPMGSMPMGAAS